MTLFSAAQLQQEYARVREGGGLSPAVQGALNAAAERYLRRALVQFRGNQLLKRKAPGKRNVLPVPQKGI